jgi:hypothetical protein
MDEPDSPPSRRNINPLRLSAIISRQGSIPGRNLLGLLLSLMLSQLPMVARAEQPPQSVIRASCGPLNVLQRAGPAETRVAFDIEGENPLQELANLYAYTVTCARPLIQKDFVQSDFRDPARIFEYAVERGMFPKDPETGTIPGELLTNGRGLPNLFEKVVTQLSVQSSGLIFPKFDTAPYRLLTTRGTDGTLRPERATYIRAVMTLHGADRTIANRFGAAALHYLQVEYDRRWKGQNVAPPCAYFEVLEDQQPVTLTIEGLIPLSIPIQSGWSTLPTIAESTQAGRAKEILSEIPGIARPLPGIDWTTFASNTDFDSPPPALLRSDNSAVLVVEPNSVDQPGMPANNHVLRIDALDHWLKSTHNIDSLAGKVIGAAAKADNQLGHALHVGYLIGGSRLPSPWSDLSTSADVSVLGVRELGLYITELCFTGALECPGRVVVNLSMSPGKVPCGGQNLTQPEEANGQALRVMSIVGDWSKIKEGSDKPIMSIAVPQGSANEDCLEDTGSWIPAYRLVDQFAGRGDVIAIVGLKGDGRTLLSSTYATKKAIVIAAIGEAIPSLDVENASFGIRARTGSSHATAVVSSLIAAKRGREPTASPMNVKAMLLGTAKRYQDNCTDSAQDCRTVDQQTDDLLIIGRFDWSRFKAVSADEATVWFRGDASDCPDASVPLSGRAVFFKKHDNSGRLADMLASGLATRNIIALYRRPTSMQHVMFDVLSVTHPRSESDAFTLSEGVRLQPPQNYQCSEEPTRDGARFSADCLSIVKDNVVQGVDLRCVQQMFVRGQP